MNSYLEMILMAICGRIGTPGGNVFPGHLMPLGPHSDERDPRTWRTVETDFPPSMGYFPPNVLPEEILSKKEERTRALIVSSSNPLRSYADSLLYEKSVRGTGSPCDHRNRHVRDRQAQPLCAPGKIRV